MGLILRRGVVLPHRCEMPDNKQINNALNIVEKERGGALSKKKSDKNILRKVHDFHTENKVFYICRNDSQKA